MIAQATHIVTLGNALGKVEHTAVALADAVVTAHGDIAKHSDLLIGAAGLLPSLNERTVMEINRKLIIGRLKDLHFKDKLCGLGKKRFAQALEAIRLSLLNEVSTLRKTATLYGIATKISRYFLMQIL